MANDGRWMEDMHHAHTAPAGSPAAADDAAADPMATAIGYEAADPALLASVWGEPAEFAPGDRR